MDRIVEPLRSTVQAKVKANSVKQEYEKQDELKRSALRAISALCNIPDASKIFFVLYIIHDLYKHDSKCSVVSFVLVVSTYFNLLARLDISIFKNEAS